LLIDAPNLDPILVTVDQREPHPLNFLIGGLWAYDERLQLTWELGAGGRQYVITGLTVRF
jgi:hypothetical protein